MLDLSDLLPYLEIDHSNIRFLSGAEVREPYRGILVHSNDLTPTIEHIIGCQLGIVVVRCHTRANVLFRHVQLVPENDIDTPLALGYISVSLNTLSERARSLVIDGKRPFGTILRTDNIVHTNTPRGFFRMTLPALLSNSLRVPQGHTAYGRYGEITNEFNRPLAKVMEILSPFGLPISRQLRRRS